MKTFFAASLLVIVFLARTVRAGGPDVEMEKAHIDAVEFDHRGVVLTVSGTVKLFVRKTAEDDAASGNAKWVSVPMKAGEIRSRGSELYALGLAGRDRYEQRIRALKGTEQLLQMWDAEAAMEGGYVTRISARLIGVLIPQKGERRFAIDRLEELSEEPK